MAWTPPGEGASRLLPVHAAVPGASGPFRVWRGVFVGGRTQTGPAREHRHVPRAQSDVFTVSCPRGGDGTGAGIGVRPGCRAGLGGGAWGSEGRPRAGEGLERLFLSPEWKGPRGLHPLMSAVEVLSPPGDEEARCVLGGSEAVQGRFGGLGLAWGAVRVSGAQGQVSGQFLLQATGGAPQLFDEARP